MSEPSRELVHLCARSDWAAVPPAGPYRPPSLQEVGFIHLSTAEQVHLPANRLYAGRTDLVLLYLKQELLTAPLRWEPGVPGDPDGMLFPHLYGPLSTAAVRMITPYLPDAEGRFAPLPG